MHFSPEAGYTFGLILPFCSVLISTLAIFGLLEVGDTIGDPFGKDPEDFAVLHFVEVRMGARVHVGWVGGRRPNGCMRCIWGHVSWVHQW